MPTKLPTPIAALPAIIPCIRLIIPCIIPNISATDAIANAAATTGIDVISCDVPAGVNNNRIPPTLGIKKL